MYIKLLGFFLGFLITLLIINYITIEKTKIETFNTLNPIQLNMSTNDSSSIPQGIPPPVAIPEAIAALYASQTPIAPPTTQQQSTTPPTTQPTTQQQSTTSSDRQGDLMDAKFIPYKGNKYMSINTFADIKLISNEERRWYESDIDKTKIREITDNTNHYFTFGNNINLIPNEINKNGSAGANINGIQLNGPKSFYFANNKETNEVTEFTVIISGKIKEVKNGNNILFELTGNTETINAQNLDYSPSVIYINLIKIPNGNFDISITIGNVVYKGLISNIDKNTILMSDFTVLCLVYTSSEITFYLNRQKFTYKNTDAFKVKLGSTPIILNKGGLVNMDLYNFIYYKTFIPVDEINNFTKNTYYYLSGLDFTSSQCQNTIQQSPKEQEANYLENKIKELESRYIKSLEQKTKDLEQSVLNKSTFNLNPLSFENKLYNPVATVNNTLDIAAKGVKLDKSQYNQSFMDKFLSWLF